MTHREPVVVPDVYADARIPHDVYRSTFVKSMVMAPIRTVAPIGAIGSYRAEPHTATEEELHLLQALADSTSVAIENIEIRNDLERRVLERTNQLQIANQELEAFSYSVSHDLRAPLATILGFAQLMNADRDLRAHPRLQRFISHIVEAAERMNSLIDDLLKLSQVSRSELQCENVDLSKMAREAIKSLQRSSPARRVKVKIAPGIRAFGDPRLLRIVLDNLLSNTWKYSSKQPNPTIEVGIQHGATPVYFVRDNGAGFDMRHVGRLFRPFERLHSQAQFPGTGVGLTTAQRMIHKHGGEIWAESDIGKGATFFFTLAPRSDASVDLTKEMVGY